MRAVTVRRAQPFDAGAMAGLLRDIRAVPPDRQPVTRDALRDWMARGDLWHVAEVAGDLTGFQWIGPRADLPADTCDIATFVAAGRHDLATGSALWEATRKAALSLNYKWIRAELPGGNSGARSYYRSRGFEEVPRGSGLAEGTARDDNEVVTKYRL